MGVVHNIYLIGYMGSGKSTVGRLLANTLQYAWVDIDRLIEERSGKDIPGIFAEKGEEVFRELETTVIRAAADCQRVVVSTGGGTPLKPENWSAMKSTGVIVYLKAPAATLAQRLEKESEVRPLIKDKRGKELEAFVSDHLQEREEVYQQADLTIDWDICEPAGMEKLVSAIRNYSR